MLENPSTGEHMFGAGIEYGLLLRTAKTDIPEGGDVALMNLSWDGGDTGFAARSACPICMQVMNTNSGSTDAVGLISYLPKIEVSESFKQEESYKQAVFHMMQECIGKILECIESRAEHGFTCRIGGSERLFFPRLGAMSLDTIERVKYFGLRNVRSCPYCTLRNGRSASRRSRRQDPDVLDLKFRWALREAHTRALIGHTHTYICL